MGVGTDTGIPLLAAARRLGISKAALHKRVVRGSVEAYKDDKGRWLVVLPPIDAPPVDAGMDRRAPSIDTDVDASVDPPTNGHTAAAWHAMVDELSFLRGRVQVVAVLERELAARAREISELHVLLGQMTQRQLPPVSSTARELAKDASHAPEPNIAPDGVQRGSEPFQRGRPSWWRRLWNGGAVGSR